MKLMNNWPNLPGKTRLFLICFFISLVGLLVTFTGNHLFIQERFLWSVWLMQCIPLIIFLPGTLALHRRSYLWLCFILLLYFIKAVIGTMSLNANVFDFSFLVFVILLYTASMLSAREIYKFTQPTQPNYGST